MSTIALSQQEDSVITNKDRQIEALIQLHENKLLTIQNFELNADKEKISAYMAKRDILIQGLYTKAWIQKNISLEKDIALDESYVIINEQGQKITGLKEKISRKNKTILILVGVDVVIILGLLLLK